MNVIISGQAGVALLLDGATFLSFDVDDPDTLLPRRQSDLHLLFGEATDLQFIEKVDHKLAADELERAFNRASALDLALILFDAELSDEVRGEAAEELERLISDQQVITYLENILYGRPLPAAADMAGALTLGDSNRTPNLSATLQILEAYQPAIRDGCRAWDELPADLFGGNEQKEEFQHVAVQEGLFRELAVERANQRDVGRLLLKSLLNPALTSLKNHREVLQQWTKPFLQRTAARAIRHEVAEPGRQESLPRQRRHGRRGHRRSIDREAVLKNVQSQKALIIEALRRYDLDRARRIINELVTYQLENGESIFAVKSLCDLAIEAKVLGINSLQIELTKRGIDILPDDAWTWAQYGDALLNGQRLNEALEAYEQSRAFGHGVSAQIGRAGVLKALGRLNEALITYDSAIAEHPENVVAKNGRAETLRALGRLPEALAAYDEVMTEYPENAVAKTGRAETLRALGRLPEALAAYDEVVAEHPQDEVARTGRSCILVALRRYNEALEYLPNESPTTLSEWIGYHIRGMIFLRMGKIEEAVKVFRRGVNENPWAASREYFRTALAVACLRRRDFIGAASILDEVTAPLLQPQANVLRLHAFGASGDTARAVTAYQNLSNKPWYISDELVEELHRQHIIKEQPRYNDDWIFDQEDSVNLLVANQQLSTSSFSAYY